MTADVTPPADEPGAADEPGDPAAVSYLPVAASWAVAHTKARSEKVVAEFFGANGVPYFLPLVTKRRSYGARVRESQLPLFPGYVFFDPTAVDRLRVFGTRKVAKVLVPDDADALRSDLENLAHALAVEPSFRRHEWGDAGTPVHVISGPLEGVQGKLVRSKGESLLVIQIDFVGFGAEVEIDTAHLAPAA